MSFLAHGSMAKSPFAYLFKGLFPNLARYLAGATNDTINRTARTDIYEDDTGRTTEKDISAESRPTGRSLDLPHQAISRFEQLRESESPSVDGSSDIAAHISRPEVGGNFDYYRSKRSECRSLILLPLSHSRDVSGSSNATVVWNTSDSSSSTSPIVRSFGQELQDTAERTISKSQADEIHELEETIRKLRSQVASQTQQVEGLQNDLAISERDRQTNFNMALRYYQKQGKPRSIDLRNLTDYVEQLRDEIYHRDDEIQQRDELIEALSQDVRRYASHDYWAWIRECFYTLQLQYGRLPQDYRALQRDYGDLQDEHVDVCNRLRKLEGDLAELKVELDQVWDERDQLEDDVRTAEQRSAEVESRYWAMKSQRDELSNEKADSDQADSIPSLPKGAFEAPSPQNLEFGGSNGAVPLPAAESNSSTVQEAASEPARFSIFDLSSASNQAPHNADDAVQFEQDFNFGGHKGAVSFTASQKAPSSVSGPGPELDLAAASLVLGTSSREDVPAVTAPADTEVPKQEPLDKDAIKEETIVDVSGPSKPSSKKARARAKKAQKQAQKKEEAQAGEHKAEGPNRSQRRAASRERKAAEKKVQAATKKAQTAEKKAAEQRRKAAAMATMRG